MARKYPGIFITLEGIDFSGKTTQAKKLVRRLKKLGLDYIFLREPGGTGLSERIRRILLSKGEIEICPKSELWLYLAARSQIVAERILPALISGQVVLCDRFYDSTVAYQVYGRGLDEDFILKANLYASENLKPDLTLLFDLPEKVAFARKAKLKRSQDRLEKEKLSFFRKVRRGYLKIAEKNPRRFQIVDADRPVEDIFEDSLSCLLKFLKKRKIIDADTI